MTRLFIGLCPHCKCVVGNLSAGKHECPACEDAILERVEVLSADSVTGLVEAADSLAGRVEDIVDTANWQKSPVTVARKLAVPLGKYQAAREAFPTQPEPEQGGSEEV